MSSEFFDRLRERAVEIHVEDHLRSRLAKGEKLRARGRVLQAGRTNSVGAADVYIVSAEQETLCGTVLATTRNFQIKA